MNITLRQLEYLTALAATGHFGRAAAAVNVTQPALSVQIQELETRLGVQLVERQSRRALLTPAGREVLRRAETVLSEIREIADVGRRGRGLSGRLRLGVIPTVAPYLLPEALPVLRARDLALDLGMREAQTETLLDELEAGALDAAVIALPSNRRGLHERALFRDEFRIAGSARRIRALGPAPRPETVAPDQLLLLDEGHCLSDQVLAACALGPEGRHMDLRAASLTTLCRLCAEGFGLTLVPAIAARVEQVASPDLKLRAFADPAPARIVGLVGRASHREAEWFEDLARLLADAGCRIGGRSVPLSVAPRGRAAPGGGPGDGASRKRGGG